MPQDLFWHCSSCWNEIRSENIKDITLDINVLKLLQGESLKLDGTA